MADVIVVADAHLDQQAQKLARFLSFLDFLRASPPQALYLLGDLFTIWLGTAKMQLPHQATVVAALRTLQAQGIRLTYVEGNRDYFLAPCYLHAPFQEIAAEHAQARIGDKRVYFAHGDLVNAHDQQYRLWRSISRNRLLYRGFECLPRAVAVHFVHYLERAFRETNQRQKAAFPAETCADYARRILETGYDAIILGHFHEERQQTFAINGQPKYLYVLPAWKDTPTYLRITAHGACVFQQFG